MGMVGVDDQRLPALEFVVQKARQPGVPPLRHAACEKRRFPFRRIVEKVEVLGLEHLEVELLVLDFVPTEVLGLGGTRGEGAGGQRQHPDDVRGLS